MTQAARQYKSGRYAAIDIGTVTARLLVADVDENGGITELHRDTAICNLGVGVDKTGRLNPEAIQRVGEVVGRFVKAIDGLQPEDGAPITVIANATSASRDAENSDEFVDVLAKLGVVLSVIPGEKEAGLSFAGASSAFPGEAVVVLDVGGGSSEIIAGQAGEAPKHAHSFNIGCRRVTERCLHDDPPTKAQMDEASNWIAGEMRELDDRDARVAMLDRYPELKTMYDPDDGNTAVYCFTSGKATLASFTAPPETLAF